MLFICISSLRVYTTLGAGWSSNSKYSLLGSLRGVAQTISYEVSISLTLLGCLLILSSLNLSYIYYYIVLGGGFILAPLLMV